MIYKKKKLFQALQGIDGEIVQRLSLRRKHREVVGPSYYDASMRPQGPLGVITDAISRGLHPKSVHLSHFRRVYEVAISDVIDDVAHAELNCT